MKLCACGCGNQLQKGSPMSRRKYNDGHRPVAPFIKMTYEHISDKIINEIIRRKFYDNIIEIGLPPMNKKLNTPCWTMKPRRGSERTHPDRYIGFSVFIKHLGIFLEQRAHIVSTLLHIGEIIHPNQANHHCDRKMCVRPDHIYIGTQKENRLDFGNRRGTQRPDGVMTRHQFESIKYYINLGEHTLTEIADHFGFHNTTISNIATGKISVTTDGSEVIGNIFVPTIIPESKRIKKVRDSIFLGKELISFKRGYGTVSRDGQSEFSRVIKKKFNISYGTYKRLVRMAKVKIHEDNFKVDITKLYQMIRQGIDLSKPI